MDVAGLVGGVDTDLPPVAFHALGWASTARAKDQSPPFDPMAARVTPCSTQTTRRLRKGWRDSSVPTFNVAQIRRRSAGYSLPRAGVGSKTGPCEQLSAEESCRRSPAQISAASA